MMSKLFDSLPEFAQPAACRRTGLTRIEIVVLAIILIMGALLLGPWVLRQRAAARRNVCQSNQYAIARAHLLRTSDTNHLVGFRNPGALRVIDAENPDQPIGWVEPIMFYIYSLRSKPDDASRRENELEESFELHNEQQLPAGEYYTKLQSEEPRFIPKIYELNCPDQGQVDYRNHPDASTTVVNSGMPDVSNRDFPRDWRANGPFVDSTDDNSNVSPVSLDYIEDHDGLSNTMMLTENLDAAGWLSDIEAENSVVWRDFPDGKRGETLLAINQQGGLSKREKLADPYLFARPSSFHVGGVNVVFCDGSTRFLSQNIDYVIFALMMSCDDENTRQAGSDKLVSDYYRREKDRGE